MIEKDLRAQEIVKRYSMYAAGAGLIPIPAADMAAIAAIEFKMLAELAKVYEVPFKNDRVRPILASVIGGFAASNLGTGVGGSMLKSIPLIGTAMGVLAVPAFAAGLTYAVGAIFTQHFASGGTFLDFDPEKVRTYFKKAAA